MADSDFGQLWAELVLKNGVSPQLRQIVEDLKLVDGSIKKTRDLFSAFDEIKLSHGVNELEKNWRSMRGAIADVRGEITKTQDKMKNLENVGLGDTSQYKQYEEKLKQLVKLRNELLSYGRKNQNAGMMGSEDISRFKSEFQVIKKEIAATDAQAKGLASTQQQNVSVVERMVQQYGKMAQELSSVRQQALDSGMTTMGTQWLQNTVNRIQSVSQLLQQALNNPSSITNNMVQNATRQFEHLEQVAKRSAERMRDYLSAKTLQADSQTALTNMEARLEGIRNKLRSIKDDRKINVDTSGLEAVQTQLRQFIEKYKALLGSGGINKTVAADLAMELKQITAEGTLATKVLDGLVAAERRSAAASQQAARSYDPIIQKMQQLQTATTRTGRIWEQFKTQIAFTAFSIYGIESFLKNVITIGGEFERQRVALQNMLGDMREASEIFGQLKNLALESPFTFRQLSTYTKQLAAFSIPYEELFNTNKRLSDMSAGLGVDMSRLILAYGQVRAATVLRGQELRQFTEAGVPLVEKLADYFTKLNGQLVTTKDIFKMISAKQVPFEAVRSVMMEMTDEGGMFYNMQAKIADTLSGRWGNLKDAWEILLGEIADGESIIGKALKVSVEGITDVIRSMRTLLGLIGGLAVGRVLSGAYTIFAGGAGIGKTGIERQFLQAKALYAVELQRKAVTGQIAQYERNIIRDRNIMTALDYKRLTFSGMLDKYETAMLYKRQRITWFTAREALLRQGLTAAGATSLLNMTRMELVMRRIGSSLAGVFLNPTTWITGALMAVGALIGAIVQYNNKLSESRKNLAEQATQTRNDLSQFLNTNDFKEGLDAAEAARTIEKYEEELKKLAPNFIEIKSRIVGEHGESPEEQAKAYRDKLQDYLNNSSDAEYVARTAFDDNNRGFGRDSVVEKANAYYKEMRNLRDEALRLDPVKLKEMVGSMDGLNKSTKDQINLLIDQGKKLEAIKRISDELSKPGVSRSVKYPDTDFYKAYANISGTLLYGSNAQTEYKDAADEYFKKLKEQIVNSYRSSFDDDGKWIGAANLKDQLIKGFRDALSEAGADENAMSGLMMRFESDVFGKYSTLGIEKASSQAVKILGDTFISKNQDLVKKFRENGGVMTQEIEDQLDELAMNIGMTDLNFMQHVNYLVNAPGHNEIYKYLRVVLNMDDEQEWQTELIRRFGDNEQYKAKIKASPDIPTALDACQKLFNEARDKLASMGQLMLDVGIKVNVDKPTPLKPDDDPWWQTLLPWQKQAAQEYQKNADIIAQGVANGLKAKTPKGSGGSKKTGGKGHKEDKELQAWRNHVDLYKKFLDQYRDLTKMYGEKEALDKLQKSDSYTWLRVFADKQGISLTDIDSMNEALSKNLDTSKGDKQKRKEALAKRIADLEAEGYKRAADELKRVNATLDEQLKILNEQYDAYKKIFLITGNKEGAMQLAFGGQVTNERYIDDLTSRLTKELKKIGSGKTLDEVLGMDKESINKAFGEDSEAANLINKLKEERNKLEKEYLDVLATALSSDMSLEDKRAEAQRRHNEQMEKLIELRKKDQALADKAIEAENRRFNREDAGFEQQIFERDTNMSGLLNNAGILSRGYLRAMLVQLRSSLSRYANDNTPEGISARKKLEEQILKVSDALDDLHDHITDVDDDFYTGGDGKRYIRGVTATRYNLNQDQEVDAATEARIRSAEKFRKLNENIDKASKAFKALEDILKPVIDLLDALGMEDTPFGQALSGASNALSSAGSVAGAFQTLSQVAGPESGIGGLLSAAGPYGAAAAAALSVATTIFQMHDKALQKEIEASEARQKTFEDISSNLETILERTLGSIYTAQMDDRTREKYRTIVGGRESLSNSGLGFWEWVEAARKFGFYTKDAVNAMKEALSSGSFYDANKAALFAQRDEIQHQIDLEKKKKKSDNTVISDLEQKLVEIDDTIKHYATDIAKELYDIDIKSWAKSLAETIVDAWAKGEDAVEAYKNKVKEIMRDLAVNIISMKYLEKLLEPVEDYISTQMDEKNGMLDENDIEYIANKTLDAANAGIKFTYDFLDKLKEKGLDLSDVEDKASTLGKGIASITEDTADLLASYINAIRADVAIMRAIEERILESGFLETNTNLALQLTELRNISAFAERNALAAEQILDLFNSVTTVSANGRKVRV